MLVNDIKLLPNVGDYVVMGSSITGELERLKAVLLIPDDEFANTVHVFFASDDPKDNVNEENGVKYFSIRTYIDI